MLYSFTVKTVALIQAHEADYLPPSHAEVKNAGSYTSTLSIHLHGMVLS